MSFSEITQVERAVWQRRAAAELAAILRTHGDLPPLTWTVGPAGSVLLGQVSGLASAAETRAVFSAWTAALRLDEPCWPTAAGAVVHLRAAACRNRVCVRVTAIIFAADGEQ